MKNKKWLLLIIFGIFLISLFLLVNVSSAKTYTRSYGQITNFYNGYNGCSGSNWGTIRNTTIATSIGDANIMYIGTAEDVGLIVNYNIYRSYIFFDTSTLPIGCSIISAKIYMHENVPTDTDTATGHNCGVTINSSLIGRPGAVKDTTDYNKRYYNKSVANYTVMSTAIFNVSLNRYNEINPGGTTSYIVRGRSTDVNNSAVTKNTSCYVTIAGEDLIRLWITYSYNAPPNNDNAFLPNSTVSGTVYISYPNVISVNISDLEGDSMNQKFETNASGLWLPFGWHNNTYNGTKSTFTDEFHGMNRTFYWSSNVTDGQFWDNDTYHFYIIRCPSHNITYDDNTINVSGSYQNKYNFLSGYIQYINLSGLLTPIHFFNNTENITLLFSYKQNNTGYWIYNNDTGNITSVTWLNNHLRTVWYHNKTLLVNNSWLINDYDVGNYTGLVLINNSVNTTGTTEYQFRPLLGLNGEYWVWINLTGIPAIITLHNFTVGLNFTNLSGFITWTGDYISNNTNISFNVSSNMTLNGTVNVNEDSYFLSGILTFENSQFFLMLLIGLWLFFVSEYIKYKESILAWIQLIFCFPVVLFLSSIAYFNSIPLVIPIIFIIPILGIYLVVDAVFYSKGGKKRKD